ncbi:hypothetical protein AGR6A_pTi0165 [Agrobacterium sp. NCPPB 925]|nr:hypothetical protein AGR6A_pTi0165 [Agrobacterium sp. NCPPB 925]
MHLALNYLAQRVTEDAASGPKSTLNIW